MDSGHSTRRPLGCAAGTRCHPPASWATNPCTATVGRSSTTCYFSAMQRIKPISEGTPQAHRLQDADLLDEQEQRELIEAMERAAGRQRCYSKALLCMLGLLLAALYFGFAGLQLVRPWQTAHQARFDGHLRQHSMVAAELAGAATALLAVGAVLSIPGHSWSKLLAGSALLAALQTVFWGVAIARVQHADQAPLATLWRLLWLPAVPPCFVALMALACATLRGTDADVQRLRSAQYNYKRA